MIGRKDLIDWLAHRAGVVRRKEYPSPFQREAFELNERGSEFIDNFGNRQICSYVGFVDLIGFCERVKGLPPREVRGYLECFLEGLTTIAVQLDALVDKTIGDEIMFVVPDAQDHGHPPAILRMGQLLGSIHDFQQKLGDPYRMRIGLSFGTVLVGYIDGNGYREWTLFGETVHLAKRLHALKGLKTQYGLHGAFGILTSERDAPSSFRNSLGLMAGTASRMTHEVVDGTVEDLKGVSPAYCAHLFPKNPSS